MNDDYYINFRKAENMRRNKAATKIQAAVRGYLDFIKYKKMRNAALGLQKLGRGCLARRKFLVMKRNNAVSYYFLENVCYCYGPIGESFIKCRLAPCHGRVQIYYSHFSRWDSLSIHQPLSYKIQ